MARPGMLLQTASCEVDSAARASCDVATPQLASRESARRRRGVAAKKAGEALYYTRAESQRLAQRRILGPLADERNAVQHPLRVPVIRH